MKQQIQELFTALGIVETTTKNKKTRGTRSFMLPIGIEVASYKSGYIRRTGFRMFTINGFKTISQYHRCWQINKREGSVYSVNGKKRGTYYTSILVHDEDTRLLMLVNYYLKIKHKYE